MSSLFNADSNEALSGSSTRISSNSKESSGRPIIGLSSPKEKQNSSKRSFSKASSVRVLQDDREGTGLSDILLEAGFCYGCNDRKTL
jgi:hypothetical protein